MSPVVYPERPVVGVGCLVIEGGRILLVRRAYPPGKGKWSIPGGHVELGEPVLRAAARELLEETGVEGEPLGVVNVDDAITVDENGVKYHYVLVTVLLRRLKGEPRPGGDALEAGFYRLEEAKRLDLTPATRGLIDKIESGRLCLEKPIPVGLYRLPD